MIKQRTLKSAAEITGIGVHSGKKVSLTIRPAPANHGVVFIRTDLTPAVQIPARFQYIGDTKLATSLVKENAHISTVEHLLSAFAGMGIDNALVDLDSAEVPIMDGSAVDFVTAIQAAGINELTEPKRFIRIKETITVKEGDKWAELAPHEGFKIKLTIDFKHPVFDGSNQTIDFDFNTENYRDEIAGARTFGFLKDYEYIRKNNLALGASLDNTIVLDDDKVMNSDGLRYPNEFVRHKLLDVMGDLYLLGNSLIGSYTGFKSGHALNGLLAKKVLANPQSWEYVTK